MVRCHRLPALDDIGFRLAEKGVVSIDIGLPLLLGDDEDRELELMTPFFGRFGFERREGRWLELPCEIDDEGSGYERHFHE